MRFGLKCVITLTILYRAIIMSQGGMGTTTLTSTLAEGVPLAETRIRDEAAARLAGWCRRDPAGCLASAARLSQVMSDGTGDRYAEAATGHGPGATRPAAR